MATVFMQEPNPGELPYGSLFCKFDKLELNQVAKQQCESKKPMDNISRDNLREPFTKLDHTMQQYGRHME